VVFGIAFAKFSQPVSRGKSILVSPTLCGHEPTQVVAFRLINVRKHAVLEPNIKVFIVTPQNGRLPLFLEVPFTLSIPIEFLELPQTVSVPLSQVPPDRKLNAMLVVIFSAGDPASGNSFEVRKTFSLEHDVLWGKDFAPLIGGSQSLETISARVSLDLNRFYKYIDSDESRCPDWAPDC